MLLHSGTGQEVKERQIERVAVMAARYFFI